MEFKSVLVEGKLFLVFSASKCFLLTYFNIFRNYYRIFEKFKETSNYIKMTKPGTANSLLDPQNYQGVHHSDIPKLLNDIQDRLHKSILRQCRQAITGDPDR